MNAITRSAITRMKGFVPFRLALRRRIAGIFLNPGLRLPLLALLCLLLPVCGALAASSGNISETEKYAWSENGGWVNFRPANGGVTVLANHLSGFAWGENAGWIKLGSDGGGGSPFYANTNAANWGVNNDGAGNLSGYAWSETAGWINFHSAKSQVTIDSGGLFHGYAWSENLGWIQLSNPALAYGVRTTGDPTVVELASFDARSAVTGVLLKWQTASEIDTAGFNLLRAEAGKTEYAKITRRLIPSEGGPAMGAAYTHADRTASLGKTYFYKLEDIDNGGASTLHGPVSAVAGSIRLIYPEKRAIVGQQALFQWESEAFGLFRIEFSARSDFSSKTVSLPLSTSKEQGSAEAQWIDDYRYTPTAAEWAGIARLAGKRGAVYWRVVGKAESGGVSPSVAWGIRIQ